MNTFAYEFMSGAGRQGSLFLILAVFTLSLLAALLGRRLQRHAALRHTILFAGLLSCLAAPVVAVVLAATDGKILTLPVLANAPPRLPQLDETEAPSAPDPIVTEIPLAIPDREPDPVPPVNDPSLAPVPAVVEWATPVPATRWELTTELTWEFVLMLTWPLGSALLMTFALRAWWQVRSIRQSAAPFVGRMAAIGAVRQRLGTNSSQELPALVLSDRVRTPVAVGITNPVIILPAATLAQIDDDELTDILVHETAHILRRDALVLMLQAMARCLYWPVLPIHWLNRQLESAREEICDNYVLAARDAVQYGRTLLKIAELACGERPLPAAVAMLRGGRGGGASGLESRVAGLLDGGRNRTVHLPRRAQAAIGATFLCTAVLACGTRLVTQADDNAPAPPGESRSDIEPAEVSQSDETPADTPQLPEPPANPRLRKLPAKEPVDPAEVRRKIAALAVPDETVPEDDQPLNWLALRREQIVPQLIAGLNDENPTIAEQCLDILQEVPPSKELTDVLVARAGDANSPLRYRALKQIEKSAADPRVPRLLVQASAEAKNFPDPLERARWAWLAGRKNRAVDILKPLLVKLDKSDYAAVKAIRLLGEIGEPSSVGLLEPIASGESWGLAVEAYSALAKIDPAKHALTKDQEAILNAARRFKESREQFLQRLNGLARLDANEIRPLVMQMLRDHDYSCQTTALAILSDWKETEALPQIRERIREKRSNSRREAIAAYLTIDDGQSARDVVLELLDEKGNSDTEPVLSGIVLSEIPADRKVTLLRAARARVTLPEALPQALRYQINQGADLRDLLVPLMDEETDLRALSGYCDLAVRDKEQRFAEQVRRAMKLLASSPVVSAEGERTDMTISSAAQVILGAVAIYDLKVVAPDVQKLMTSRNAMIRSAAQATGAKLGVPGAMKDLYSQLRDNQATVRQQAAQSLMSIKAVDETERAAREEAVLSCLGSPAEDYAMRVLVTCGGEKSVKALEAILDDPDVRRGVYAAWVLAQLPDKAGVTKGVRRVAIFGMFHHRVYQQGAGIDFEMAPHLLFHQATQRLNRDPRAYSSGAGPVRIPDELLMPFVLNDAEQECAVRCYRLAEMAGNAQSLDVEFLHDRRVRPQNPADLNQTYLPLLMEIAAHDSHLEKLVVKGQTVAHFEYRQRAAQAAAAITGEKATYLGLAGEMLDSNAFPEPYQNQNQLLSKFVVDRVAEARLPAEPRADRESRRGQYEYYRTGILLIKEKFGAQVLAAIRQEASRRGVNMKNILPSD